MQRKIIAAAVGAVLAAVLLVPAFAEPSSEGSENRNAPTPADENSTSGRGEYPPGKNK